MTTQEIRQSLQRVSQLRTNQYTEKENQLFRTIIDSGNRDMIGEAAYAVYTSLTPYICRTLKTAGFTPNSQNYEDLQHDMFVTIMEKMDKWEPDESSFITFIVPELRHVLFVQSDDIMSKTVYAHTVERRIQKAVAELEKTGNDDPSPSEVKAQMKLMGIDVSKLQTQTLSEHMQRMFNSDVVPFDENLNLASRFPTPEEAVINEEHIREIRESINSLGSPYREVLEALIDCMEEDPTRNSLPTYQTIADRYNELNADDTTLPIMDAETVKRAYEIAVKQFTGKYNFNYRRSELNSNSGLLVEDIENDICDITAAAATNLQALLMDEDDVPEITF